LHATPKKPFSFQSNLKGPAGRKKGTAAAAARRWGAFPKFGLRQALKWYLWRVVPVFLARMDRPQRRTSSAQGAAAGGARRRRSLSAANRSWRSAGGVAARSSSVLLFTGNDTMASGGTRGSSLASAAPLAGGGAGGAGAAAPPLGDASMGSQSGASSPRLCVRCPWLPAVRGRGRPGAAACGAKRGRRGGRGALHRAQPPPGHVPHGLRHAAPGRRRRAAVGRAFESGGVVGGAGESGAD
jgi:hypothetical protein